MRKHSILLIGATGRTGSLVIAEALSRSMQITALVRNPAKLTAHPNLTIIHGSPTDSGDILTAISASPEPITAIMVTLNAHRASDSPFAKSIAPPRLMADTHLAILAAMKSNPSIKKLITLSAFGVADSAASTGFFLGLLFRHTNIAAQYADHDLVDGIVKAAGVPYVLVRPMRLVEGEAAPVREYGDLGSDVGMFATISRTSVARFLVDAVEKEDWDDTTPVISN